jgi:hypothetical protein
MDLSMASSGKRWNVIPLRMIYITADVSLAEIVHSKIRNAPLIITIGLSCQPGMPQRMNNLSLLKGQKRTVEKRDRM